MSKSPRNTWPKARRYITERRCLIITATVRIIGEAGAGATVGNAYDPTALLRGHVRAQHQAHRDQGGNIGEYATRYGDVYFQAESLFETEQDGGAGQHCDNPGDAAPVHPCKFS